MEIKPRDKVACWAAIVFFSFFALISLLSLRPSASGLTSFSLLGVFPLLIWLVLGCIARNKLLWSFFFAACSLYILLFVGNGIEDFYDQAPVLSYAAYILGELYFFAPVLFFTVFFQRAAAIFACAHSSEAREQKKRKQERILKEEMAKVATPRRPIPGPAAAARAAGRA